jgi:hypothetical protein
MDIVQPAFQVQFLNVRVRKADLVKGCQTLRRDFLQVSWQVDERLRVEERNEISRSWIQLHRIEQVRRRQLVRSEREGAKVGGRYHRCDGSVEREELESHGGAGVDQVDRIKANREGKRILELSEPASNHSAGTDQSQFIAILRLIPQVKQSQGAFKAALPATLRTSNWPLAGPAMLSCKVPPAFCV